MRRVQVVLLALAVLPLTNGGKDWGQYKKSHRKAHRNTAEEAIRRENWRKNRTVISRHNKMADTEGIHYKMKETPLTDFGMTELSRTARTIPPTDLFFSRAPAPFSSNLRVPDAVDYRNSPCLPPIEFQDSPVAYQQCIKNNNSIPLSLSKQQLVDCSSNPIYGNRGCSGGWYEKAWKYVSGGTHGLFSGISYPYTASMNGTCKSRPDWPVLARVVSYTPVGQWNETALKLAVALKGPISVAICATCQTFTNYGSGIYEDPGCNCSANHGVTVVGYGTSFGVDYWIVRNSWGKTWGLGGYALLKRGVNQNNIGFWPSFPTIA